MNKFTIQSKTLEVSSNPKELKIIPFGDVHFACPQHAAKFFNADIREWKKMSKGTYFVGMGDYMEFTGYSECKKLRGSNLRQSTSDWIDERVKMDLDLFVKKIKWMGDRLLGLIQGNHGWIFCDGTTDTEYLCKQLGCPFLGEVCYYRLRTVLHGNNTSLTDIVLHHGKAGGKLYGTSINQVADLRNLFREADIYIMGHNHDKGGWPVLHASVDRHMNLQMKTQYLCRSGSYRRSYIPNTEDYVHHSLYRPSPIGYIKLSVKFKRDQSATDRTIKEIHCWS